jgi:hypothetical protein
MKKHSKHKIRLPRFADLAETLGTLSLSEVTGGSVKVFTQQNICHDPK